MLKKTEPILRSAVYLFAHLFGVICPFQLPFLSKSPCLVYSMNRYMACWVIPSLIRNFAWGVNFANSHKYTHKHLSFWAKRAPSEERVINWLPCQEQVEEWWVPGLVGPLSVGYTVTVKDGMFDPLLFISVWKSSIVWADPPLRYTYTFQEHSTNSKQTSKLGCFLTKTPWNVLDSRAGSFLADKPWFDDIA